MARQSRLEAAMKRLGIKDSTEKKPLPNVPKALAEALLALYPVRMIAPGEDIRAYERYCGRAEVALLLLDHCQELAQEAGAVTLDAEDDDEYLTAEAVGRAIAQHHGVPFAEDE